MYNIINKIINVYHIINAFNMVGMTVGRMGVLSSHPRTRLVEKKLAPP